MQPSDYVESERSLTIFCLRDFQFGFWSSHDCLAFSCPRGRLWPVLSDVSCKSTEHTKLVVKVMLPFFGSKLAVLP